MNKLWILGLALIMAGLAGCGDTKKVEEFSEKFAQKVNDDDIEWLRSVYPDFDFEEVGFKNYAKPEVKATDVKNEYLVTYGEETWIKVKVTGKDSFEVLASKGVAKFPAEKYKIGVSTGMLNDEMDDVEIQQRLDDDQFFDWFYKQAVNVIDLSYSKTKITWPEDYEGKIISTVCTLTNKGKSAVSGKDYSITYTLEYPTCSDGSSPNEFSNEKKAGVDLNPGETKTVTIREYGEAFHDISISFNMSPEQLLASYTPTGKEYKEYINIYGTPSGKGKDKGKNLTPAQCLAQWPQKMPESGNINQFAWLSEYKLTPVDLRDFTKPQLRILRNAIYAMHGYIFKSDDLRNYFNQFKGYTPVTKDVNDFNQIEKENIALIKRYE